MISNEIVQKARLSYDGRLDTPMRAAIESVLPDIERPLREEIERLTNLCAEYRDGWLSRGRELNATWDVLTKVYSLGTPLRTDLLNTIDAKVKEWENEQGT